MDKTLVKKDLDENYNEIETLGAYIFTVSNEENDQEKDCKVIVFNHSKYAYEEFIDSLKDIFNKFNIEENCYKDKVEDVFILLILCIEV